MQLLTYSGGRIRTCDLRVMSRRVLTIRSVRVHGNDVRHRRKTAGSVLRRNETARIGGDDGCTVLADDAGRRHVPLPNDNEFEPDQVSRLPEPRYLVSHAERDMVGRPFGAPRVEERARTGRKADA